MTRGYDSVVGLDLWLRKWKLQDPKPCGASLVACM